MTPAIDKRGIITYSYHKERTKKIKKVNSQGMGGYHPRFCLIQKYKLHTDLVSRLVPYQTPDKLHTDLVSRLVPYQTPEMNKEAWLHIHTRYHKQGTKKTSPGYA